ncbi:TPA: hypothetical protein DCZ39_04215 [Patescibacteria group bacterium]|nr:hypothetical protein [Candidatus Gracilibacteria bacterium]
MIFDAFAKKNEKKIKRKIQFENRKEITTVVPLLSFYLEGNEKNYKPIYFIIIYDLTHVMYN